MKLNPIPAPDCTESEAVQYLENHIKILDDKIEELNKAYEDAERDSQLRGWAMDRAIRVYEKSGETDFAKLATMANSLFDYANIKKPEVLQ